LETGCACLRSQLRVRSNITPASKLESMRSKKVFSSKQDIIIHRNVSISKKVVIRTHSIIIIIKGNNLQPLVAKMSALDQQVVEVG